MACKGAYVVFNGRRPGVHDTWEACEEQIDQFPWHIQGYIDRSAAEAAWQEHLRQTETAHLKPSILEEVQRLYNLVQRNLMSPQVGQEVVGDSLKRPCPTVDAIDSNDNEQPAAKKPKVGPAAVEEDIDLDQNSKATSDAEVEKIELTPAQNAVLEMALKGDNVFLTGAAGSGKTVTLKRIIECLSRRFTKPDEVQVVAPTGIAALPLDGKTTYSFAGWKPDSLKKPIKQLLGSIKPYVRKSINVLKVLIIEEISMVENQFLERLNLLLQKILETQKPFGGVQVIFVGDFHQLPPVKPFEFCLECGKEMSIMAKWKEGPICKEKGCEQKGKKSFRYGDKWAFKAPVWSKLGLRHVKLEQIHRQKEARFQNILNKIANSIPLTDQEWGLLEEKKTPPANAFAVRLMSKRTSVDSFNNKELRNLNSETHSWKAYDMVYKLQSGSADDDRALSKEMAREQENAPRHEHRYRYDLTLKVGAKVVLLCNLDFQAGLVNGSQGQVITFEENGPDSEYKSKKRPWEKRCHSFEEENHRFRPVVRFENGKVRTIEPDTKETTKASSFGQYRVSRTQIPLALAWALSIHKSQGMTLQHVNVSSKDIFETGQLYVGLSRATTLDGLTLTGYSREQILMDKEVLAFYKNTKWESLGPSHPSNSSSNMSNKSTNQGPPTNSASNSPGETIPERPSNDAGTSRTTGKAANQDLLELACSSATSSNKTTVQDPHEHRTPPNPSGNTVPETAAQNGDSSPALLPRTAKKSPLENSFTPSNPHKRVSTGPSERDSSGPAKSSKPRAFQRPPQQNSQRPSKLPGWTPFKVTKPMNGKFGSSIECREPVSSSIPRQRKPVIIDLVSSEDEG